MIKLIFSDMDGTLLDDDNRLPEGFDDMMGELRERGVRFCPASGRQYFSLQSTFRDYVDEFLFLAENGAMVVQGGHEIFSVTLPKEEVLRVLEEGMKLPGILSVFSGKENAYILRSQESPECIAAFEWYYSRSKVVENFAEVEETAVKASFFDMKGHADQTIYPFLDHLNREGFRVLFGSNHWVDVLHGDVNKGNAIRWIQKQFGISPMECAAFGDYLNDREMMSAVHYSFAMGNAHPDIKQAARFETASNQEGGVLAGIRRLMDEGLI